MDNRQKEINNFFEKKKLSDLVKEGQQIIS